MSELNKSADHLTNFDVNKYKKLFELSIDMLGIANTEGYFEMVNPASTTILGWSQEELLSMPFMDLVHPKDVDRTQVEIEKLSKGIQTINFTNRYKTKEGKYKSLSWTANPSSDGKLYTVARDVTGDIEKEKELKEKVEELERFNKVMLDREVKMMELKEEIYKLKHKK